MRILTVTLLAFMILVISGCGGSGVIDINDPLVGTWNIGAIFPVDTPWPSYGEVILTKDGSDYILHLPSEFSSIMGYEQFRLRANPDNFIVGKSEIYESVTKFIYLQGSDQGDIEKEYPYASLRIYPVDPPNELWLAMPNPDDLHVMSPKEYNAYHQ